MLSNTLKPVLPWESTIPTYGLSKILQVSCHVACNKNLLSKYVWLISAEKISFIRSCCGSNKSDGLHNKGPHTSGNIKWRSFALRFYASNPKSTWQPLLPSAKGLSFTFISYCKRVKVIFTLPFYILSFGKHNMLERSWYIWLIGCEFSWTITVDITLEVKCWEAKL